MTEPNLNNNILTEGELEALMRHNLELRAQLAPSLENLEVYDFSLTQSRLEEIIIVAGKAHGYSKLLRELQEDKATK